MNNYLNQLLKAAPVALLVMLTLPLAAQTQLAPNPQSTAPDSGLFSGGGYSINNIESINSVTGTMALNIPIAHLPPGPAGDSIGVNLVYNSTLFDMATGPAFYWVGQTEYLASYAWAYYQPSAHGGGWTYGYQYQLWSQWASNVAASYPCPSGVYSPYQWFKTYLTTPDGGNHLLLLESSFYSNGSAGPSFTNSGTNNPQEYYGIDFSGNLNHFCATGSSRFQGTLNYITIDGSYIRVQANTSTNSWQAFFPDGSVVDGRIVTDGSGEATTSDGFASSDRNNNSETFIASCTIGEPCTETLADNWGRAITINYESDSSGNWSDTLSWPSANGLVTTAVNWQTYSFNQNLPWPCSQAPWISEGVVCQQTPQSAPVVASVQLPAAVTGYTSDIYVFGYDVTSATYNWGQIHYLTMCTGTSPTNCQPQYSTQYAYAFDSGAPQSFGNVINPITVRTLNYTEVGDITGTDPITETTSFNIPLANQPLAGGTSIVTGPDGSTTTYYSANICSTSISVVELCAPLVYKLVAPDGTTTEVAWATDPSPPANFPSGVFLNPYAQYVAREVPISGGGTVVTSESTAIDGSGNVTSQGEYGFLPTGQSLGHSSNNVSSVSVLSSIPGTPLRTTTSGYYQTSSYWMLDGPGGGASNGWPLRSRLFATTRDSNGVVVAASQYSYDNPFVTANLTAAYQWDSTLGQYPGDPSSLSPTLSSANAAVSTWTYAYTGNVLTATDPNGIVTGISYDPIYLYPLKIVTAQGRPEARTTTLTWLDYSCNGCSFPITGKIASSTDSDNSVTSSYTYDNLGRTITVQQTVNGAPYRQTSTAYDDNNLKVTTYQDQSAFDDQKLVTTTYYDSLGRPRLTIDPAGNKVEKAYRFGNKVSYELTSNPYNPNLLTDPTMGWSLTTRDSMGRVINTSDYATSAAPGTSGNLTQPGNLAGQPTPASWGSNTTTTGTTSTVYNFQLAGCNGAATSFTDEAGSLRDLCPDALGRLAGVTEPNGNLTTYGYNMLDSLTSVSMGNRTFLYSSLGRQMCASNAESATAACPTSPTASQIAGVDWYTYDHNGNLTSHTDARGTYAGMTYDGQNRLTAINYTAGANTAVTPTTTYYYDQDTKGTLYESANNNGSNVYLHDKLGRVTSSEQITNGAAYSFSYTYSLTDQLIGVTYPTGRTVNYGFDAADRITSVTGPQSKTYVSNILFSPPSIPNTLSLANGLTENYGWNDRLQLTSLNAGSALSLGIFPCDQGATSCTMGNIGAAWRETITTNGTLRAVQEFRHDNLNRLYMASEKTGYFTAGPTCPDSGSVWCRQFTFDAPGNRTIAGRSPGGAEAWDVSSFSSTTNKIQNTGWNYDAAGNIVAANNAQTSVSLLYDAENRQVAYCYSYNPSCTNTPAAGVTVYYYDGEGRRVEQIDPTTGTTVFVYDAFGNLVADYGGLATPSSGTEYVTVDDVGTTRLITDGNANVMERHDFEPFGWELAGTEAGWRTSVAGYGITPTSVRQQFTGQERDSTGLDFFQARYFTSAQGRFSSVDPGNAGASLFDPQSWNGYSYVSNSPLTYTDPSGLGFWDDLGSFLGNVISNLMGGWLFGGFGGGGGGVVGGIAGSVNSSQPWNEQLPTGAFGGSLNTGTVFGSGNTGGTVFSFAGGDPPTGFWYGWLWMHGLLPDYIYYGGTTHGTLDMKRSTVVQSFKRAYVAAGCPANFPIDSGHAGPWKESARNLVVTNTTQFEVGGFNGVFTTGPDRSTTVYTLRNVTGWSSLLGESTWGKAVGLKPDALDTRRGPGHNVMQTFTWLEPNPCGK